jgi:NAD(P)-dependent dehydrogenase (short-subunit alcohol dehydrogenase family)
MKRMGTAQEIADLVAYLASQEIANMIGQVQPRRAGS